MANKSNGSLIFVFITVFVDALGIGIILPVMPKLIEKLTGGGLADAAFYGGLLMTAYAAMQFIFAPVLGELSDKFGRRPVLLIALLGLGLDYIFHAYAPSITWLFIGRIISGMAGASHTVATAYVADISTAENRAKSFGLIGAAFGIGFIFGPTIGGLTAEISVNAPFFVAAVLTLLNFLYGFFFIPESLSVENRRKINYSKMIPGNSILKLLKYSFGGLILALFLAHLSGSSLPATWSYFTMEVYEWEEWEVGLSLSAVGIMVAIVQGFLIGFSVKKFGETKVMIGGFLLWTFGMTLFAFATNQWLLYIFLIPYALGGVAGPTLQGYMSNRVSEKEQGNLQGSITGMISLTTILGPLISTSLFYYFSNENTTFYFPGAPYLMSGIILFISTIIVYYSLKKIKTIQKV